MRVCFNFLFRFTMNHHCLRTSFVPSVCDFDVNALLARRVLNCDEEVGG